MVLKIKYESFNVKILNPWRAKKAILFFPAQDKVSKIKGVEKMAPPLCTV